MSERSHVYSSCFVRHVADSAAPPGKERVGEARNGVHVEERAVRVEHKG